MLELTWIHRFDDRSNWKMNLRWHVPYLENLAAGRDLPFRAHQGDHMQEDQEVEEHEIDLAERGEFEGSILDQASTSQPPARLWEMLHCGSAILRMPSLIGWKPCRPPLRQSNNVRLSGKPHSNKGKTSNPPIGMPNTCGISS